MDLKEEKKKNTAQVTVKISLDSEEMRGFIEDVYRQKAKNLKLPGFRKGKAPMNLVEKRLGDTVLPDAIEFAIDKTVQNSWEELKFPPITEPKVNIDKYDPKKGLEFTLSYDTKPEIKLGKYKKSAVTITDVEVTDADVQGEIDRMRERMVEYKKIEDENAVVGIKQKIILNATSAPDGQDMDEPKELSFFTRDQEDVLPEGEHALRRKIENEIWGKKQGETAEFEFTYGDEEEEAVRGKTYKFKVEVAELHDKILPEADDMFAKKATSEFQTIAELRADIKAKMQEHGEGLIKQKALDEILDKIAETSSFIIPDGLVDKDVHSRAHNLGHRIGLGHKSLGEMAQLIGKTEEVFRKELEDVSRKQIKNHLIMTEVGEKEEFTVEPADIDAEYEKLAQRGGEDLESVKKKYQDEDREWELETEIRNRKVLDFLYEKNTKKKGKPVAYAELVAAEQQGGPGGQ